MVSQINTMTHIDPVNHTHS